MVERNLPPYSHIGEATHDGFPDRPDGLTVLESEKIAMLKEDRQNSHPNESQSLLSDQIKRAIRHRAGRAVTKDDLVRAVFDSFRAQQIELRSVSLEDMKAALVEAARAARHNDPMAA